MKPLERLIVMALRDGPLSLEALSENTGIAVTNIYRYLPRLKRAHYIVMQREIVDDKDTWVIYRKTGYLHDPEASMEVAFYDKEEETTIH
jgi:DNA-binding transcriptional ArsR family regulator